MHAECLAHVFLVEPFDDDVLVDLAIVTDDNDCDLFAKLPDLHFSRRELIKGSIDEVVLAAPQRSGLARHRHRLLLHDGIAAVIMPRCPLTQAIDQQPGALGLGERLPWTTALTS